MKKILPVLVMLSVPSVFASEYRFPRVFNKNRITCDSDMKAVCHYLALRYKTNERNVAEFSCKKSFRTTIMRDGLFIHRDDDKYIRIDYIWEFHDGPVTYSRPIFHTWDVQITKGTTFLNSITCE